MALVKTIARPAVERVIEAHSGLKLLQIIAVHPRQSDRDRQEPGGLRAVLVLIAVGGAHDFGETV